MKGETLARSEARGLIETLHRQEKLGGTWRKGAFSIFCNYCYAEHVAPFEREFSDSAIAERMNTLGVPSYRGLAPWSPDKIRGIRKGLPRGVAASCGQRRA